MLVKVFYRIFLRRDVIFMLNRRMRKDQKLNYQYVLVMGLYYAAAASFLSFAVPILQQQGFNNSQIGLLLGVRALFSVLFQPFFANIMEKIGEDFPFNYLIAVMSVLSIILTVMQLITPSFFWMIAIFIFYGAFTFSMGTFIDVMSTLYFHLDKKVNYPFARATGSMLHAVMSILLGIIVSYKFLLLIQMLLFIPIIILVLKMEKVQGIKITKGSADEKSNSFVRILQDYPLFLFFLLSIILSFIGKEMVSTFLIDVFKRVGSTTEMYGFGIFILAISEVPAVVIFSKMFNKIGIYKLMIFSYFFASFRLFVILIAPNVGTLVFAQALQMLGNGLFWVGNVYFVREIMPASLAIKSQSAVGICYLGVASGIGSIVSGQILEYFSLTTLLAVSLIISFSGLIVLIYGIKKHSRQEY